MRLQQAVTMPPPPNAPDRPPIRATTSDTGEARRDDGVDGLRDRELAGIGLLQPHAAGIEQQQHGTRTTRAGAVARGAQQTDELCAVHLAERAAEETPLLRGDEDQLAVEPAAADDQSIVERARSG